MKKIVIVFDGKINAEQLELVELAFKRDKLENEELANGVAPQSEIKIEHFDRGVADEIQISLANDEDFELTFKQLTAIHYELDVEEITPIYNFIIG